MRWAQIRSGEPLHLVMEPGEETPNGYVVRKGELSDPLCGADARSGYRMNCNMPLGNACKACKKAYLKHEVEIRQLELPLEDTRVE